MSAYITLATPMIDQECLVKALGSIGFTKEKLEIHATPIQIGNGGLTTNANIVIRSRFSHSSDIGFLETPLGYKFSVRGGYVGNYGSNWISKVQNHYQKHWNAKLLLTEKQLAKERQHLEEKRKALVEAQRKEVRARAKKMGYRIKEKRQGNVLRLVLVKRAY